MDKQKKVHLVFNVPKEIKAKLQKLAKQEHRTMTGQIEYMIDKEVNDEDRN